MAMVESELRFFEMEVEGLLGDALELRQAVFGKTPEGFDSVDVVAATGKLVFTVTYPEVLGVSDIDQAVISDPPVAMNDRIKTHLSPDYPLQGAFLGVWDDLGPHAIPTFQDSKHNRFLASTSAPLAFNSVRPEVRLIDFDDTVEGRFRFADNRQSTADLEEDVVHRTHADAGQTSGRTRSQVFAKAAKDLTEFGFANFRRSVVLVNSLHNRSIASLVGCYAS